MGTFRDTDRTVVRMHAVRPDNTRTAEDALRAEIRAWASWKHDPARFEADALAAHGLASDGADDAPPSDVDTHVEPSSPTDPDGEGHIPGGSYKRGCPCKRCRDEHNAYQSDYMKRRRVEAREGGRPLPPSSAKAVRKPRIDSPECGTPGGYKKHRRNGREACDPCREAHSAACRDQRREKATKRAAHLAALQAEAFNDEATP